MLKRTLTGIALIAVLVVVLLFLPAFCTALLLSAMVVIAVYELLKTTGLVDNMRLVLDAQAIAIAITIASYFGTEYFRALIVVLMFVVVFFSEMLRTHGQLPFQQVAISIIAGALVPFLLSALVRIRVMENGSFFAHGPVAHPGDGKRCLFRCGTLCDGFYARYRCLLGWLRVR